MRDFPSRGVSWRDLWVILLHAPVESPWARALSPCGHTADDHAYMAQLHVALVANWQRAHGKKHSAPKIPDCLLPESEREVTRYVGAPVEIDEMARLLGWAPPVLN